MNKIILLLFSVSMMMMLSGCLLIPSGYTPDVNFVRNDEIKKYAVTFSVDYLSDGDRSIGRASREKYIDWLKDDLMKSGAFSSVTYKSFAQKSNYHIHFIFHYSCMPVGRSIALGVLIGYSFGTIPVWQNMFLDSSAILYLNNKPIYSPATAENLRCYIWVPFLPVGLVWNSWWAWTTQEKKCYRYLINEIIDYQRSHLQ